MSEDKSKPFARGDAVTIVGREGPEKITDVSIVRTRLGKVVGYETSGGAKWSGSGYQPGPWTQRHIVATTDAHRESIKRANIAARLKSVDRAEWAALPLDVLKTIEGHVEAMRAEKKAKEA